MPTEWTPCWGAAMFVCVISHTGEPGPHGSDEDMTSEPVMRDACVLVVDDEPANVHLLEKLLRPIEGLRFISTTNPLEAEKLFVDHHPDLVLLDLHMPKMNGVEVMAKIRCSMPEGDFVPFVILTADAYSATRRTALESGVDDFLTKPLDATEVTLRVRNLLRTRLLHLRVQQERESLAARLLEHELAQQSEAQRLSEVTERVRGVLADSSLQIVFQPITDLASGTTVGIEALSRFPQSQETSPASWFEAAHEVGLGRDLELFAVDAALSWKELIPDGVFLSVNISPAIVADGDFERFLVSRDVGAGLVIELTEHHPVIDYGPLVECVAALRERGIQFAVDDAGAGFASLQHILRLRPDLIKLDISLVRDIDADPVRRALVSSLVVFGNEMDARLIAEGIESEDELKALRDLGVNLGQGFAIARPAPLRALTAAGAR